MRTPSVRAVATKATLSAHFCDPSAKLVFRTSDNVFFRVHDCRLKAASQFFRDLLSHMAAPSTYRNPVVIKETAKDFEAILFIIIGNHRRVLNQERSVRDADRLYHLVDKYQLDAHRHWFSEIYGTQASLDGLGVAIAALFAACEGPIIDENLAIRAIRDGFSHTTPKRFNAQFCFLDTRSRLAGELLAPNNLTLAFRKKLGFKGLMAFTQTFANLPQANPNWEALAFAFVENVKRIEKL
ncbi:hypothetical protein QFC21_003188 [Naganishia friedmannii]|uniref:Uncharacterized protein n=1 Tax=Naganishia friedmannii TaxID=89922 RepID=A0ACC2VRQ2_9TREE|nr:hypothetical protein QFC21_003188 [Naganishia friedmannii]